MEQVRHRDREVIREGESPGLSGLLWVGSDGRL